MIARILLVFLLCGSVFGQELKTIVNFKGLNTRDGDLVVAPEYARIANNVDFSRFGVGSIASRKGRDSISALGAGFDSIVALATYQLRDGRRRLVHAADSTGVGYANLYAGNFGSTRIDSSARIWQYWAARPTTVTNYSDMVLFSNGQQRAVVYDGNYARNLPLPAPGDPIIVPVDSTSTGTDNLNGEYSYMFRLQVFDAGAGVFRGAATPTPNYRVNRGAVIMTGFSYAWPDTIIGDPDSCWWIIYRTKANPGTITSTDTFFNVPDTIRLYDSTTNVVYVDTSSDASLRNTGPSDRYFGSNAWYKYGRIPTSLTGPYVTTASVLLVHGAPSFINDTNVTDSTNGIYANVATKIAMNAGVSYMMTFSDTLMPIANESDSSRSTFVAPCWNTGLTERGTKSIVLGIPKFPYGSSGLIKNLYRSHWIYEVREDTITKTVTLPFGYGYTVTRTFLVYDTIFQTPYYLVAQLKNADTVYSDRMKWDSLKQRPVFSSLTSPLLSNLQESNGRLIGTNKSEVWVSDIDTFFRWRVSNVTTYNSNDGSNVTAIWPTRTADMRVMKENSSFNLYNGFSKTEIVGAWGCIAPQSHVAVKNGHFFLGREGVFFESDGANLERTFDVGLASSAIDNIEKYSMTARRNAVGFYIPDEEKYGLAFPSLDTAIIFDGRAGGAISTWTDIVPRTWTLFDTGANAAQVPAQEFYYTKVGGKTLFKYGQTTGSHVLLYRTAPLMMKPGSMAQLTSLGVWGRGQYSSFWQMRIRNELLSYADGGAALFGEFISKRYQVKDIVTNLFLFAHIDIATSGSMTGTPAIDALELYYTRPEQKGVE